MTQEAQFPYIGMSPAVWGPIFWSTIHIVTIGYPDSPSQDEQRSAVAFFESLKAVIPCPICREHYAMNLAKLPVRAESRASLVRWAFTIHNMVNEQLEKRPITFDEFIAHMKELSALSSLHLPQMGYSARREMGLGLGLGLALGVAVGFAVYTFQKQKA